MITAENIEQLCEYGSFQLGSECMPPDFNKFRNEFAQFGKHTRVGMARVDLVHPAFRSITDEILDLSGYEATPKPEMNCTVYDDETRIGTLWHRDFEEDVASGFSVLFSRSLDFGRNDILTAGRGKRPTSNKYRRYHYSDGPIVIAQSGFPNARNESSYPLGRTWHTACRDDKADFVALDILNPTRLPGVEIRSV